MLSEPDTCSISLAGVESLEKIIEAFCLGTLLPPHETGMANVLISLCVLLEYFVIIFVCINHNRWEESWYEGLWQRPRI